MKRTEVIIIGAGQAGLSVSRCLEARGIDHVVLERGRIGQSWSQRWDSLRLLSPNWMTRLPGESGEGSDPDGFMTRDEVVRFLETYARSFGAPVEEETAVLGAEPDGTEWRVTTSRGIRIARELVIATGHCHKTHIPAIAGDVPPGMVQVGTSEYRRPDQLPLGGVLVVGASASGTQLAGELLRSGREVLLSVGSHTRLPRRYRGRDILYWLERIGALQRPLTDMRSPEEARREPSLQLIGDATRERFDLEVLAGTGVRLAGRLKGFDGGIARFESDLARTVGEADRQLAKLLARVDRHVDSHGIEAPEPEPIPPVPTAGAPESVDLERAGIRSVLWATGYERSYPWLHAPVFDACGEIRQVRGRTPARGLWVIGLQFMIRRNSSFLHGIGRDAEEITQQIERSIRTSRKEAA